MFSCLRLTFCVSLFSRAPQQVTNDPLSRHGVASTQCMHIITFKSRLGQWRSAWSWPLEEQFLLCRTLVSVTCPFWYRAYPMPRHDNWGQPSEWIQLAFWRWSRETWRQVKQLTGFWKIVHVCGHGHLRFPLENPVALVPWLCMWKAKHQWLERLREREHFGAFKGYPGTMLKTLTGWLFHFWDTPCLCFPNSQTRLSSGFFGDELSYPLWD